MLFFTIQYMLMGKNYCDEKLNLIGVIHQNGLKQYVD